MHDECACFFPRPRHNAPLQVGIAEANGNNYGLAMVVLIGAVSVLIILMAAWGPERHGVAMTVDGVQALPQGESGESSAVVPVNSLLALAN